MEYNGVSFDAIIATPGCGKSYLCDNNENFIDVDEVRLKCKYIVPENISRLELEQTKGNRTFQRRADYNEYVSLLYNILDNAVKNGKTLIAAPHSESYEYFALRNIRFCFVYPSISAREEIKKRMIERGNSKEMIKENDDKFVGFYNENKKENRSVLNYEFKEDEYLSQIVKKFGAKTI